jgi:hypothetical protein
MNVDAILKALNVQRWKHIQQTITWAEANMPRHLQRNRPRVPKWLGPESK